MQKSFTPAVTSVGQANFNFGDMAAGKNVSTLEPVTKKQTVAEILGKQTSGSKKSSFCFRKQDSTRKSVLKPVQPISSTKAFGGTVQY